MPKASLPANERERLLALHGLSVLDTEAEIEFDAITETAKHCLNADVGVISLIDANRQWFKSSCGLDTQETDRDSAFCAYSILQTEPMVVLNAPRDARFADNPLVTGDPYIRFYAGAPLILPSGHAVGTLCILDFEPRYRFGAGDLQSLKFFASVAVDRLMARASKRKSKAA
ncbi:GAF domain-containing protein [Hyphobacterium sp.]|uniref:GAF domain-containing protein n=1 Tax=Hyphobacterium sp. TaxID=2004662 RepID=UPI003BAA56AD